MKAVITMRRECEESIEKSKSRLVAELQVLKFKISKAHD